MSTRCKDGDLAITFGAPDDNGLLVEVSDAGPLPEILDPAWGPYWQVKSLGSPFHVLLGVRSHTVYWPDRLLHPIRDPGDDAIDWASHRTPRSANLHGDQLTRARQQLEEVASQ